jgi:hypothetical protein
MTTTPDFRALCKELVIAVDEASDAVDRTSDCVNTANYPELWAQCVDLIRRQDDLLARARAALATPLPEPPTELPVLTPGYIDFEHTGQDREILDVFYRACNSEGGTADEIHLRGIRAVLEKWG